MTINSAQESSVYDVIIFGGGSAGLVAAAQSARGGARTLLVEKTAMLGGTITVGGVAFPGLFHAWGEQIIAGIGWDLVKRSVDLAGLSMPDFTEPNLRHWRYQVRMDPAIFAAIADELVLESGCEILFHAMPAAIRRENDQWRIDICTKTGLQAVTAHTIVDCTGDANAACLAGCALERSESLQPATLMMRVCGYDLESLDYEQLDKAFKIAVDKGEITWSDIGGHIDMRIKHFLHGHGSNTNHIIGFDASTSQGKTDLEIAARQSMMRIYRFCRAEPGLENFRIDYFAPECGVRETVTIKGRTKITCEDYTCGRTWPDSLCYSFYPIDIHRPNGDGVDVRPLQPGTVATIPLSAMLPVDAENFIAAGRIVSGDQGSNSAYRVQASCMATGQVAGAAAALAATTKTKPQDLDICKIKDILVQNNAIVPE